MADIVICYAECLLPGDGEALYKFKIDRQAVKRVYVLDVTRRLFIVEYNDGFFSNVLFDKDHWFSF